MIGPDWVLARIRSVLGNDCGYLEFRRAAGADLEHDTCGAIVVVAGCRPTTWLALSALCRMDDRDEGPFIRGRGRDLEVELLVTLPYWAKRDDSATVSDLFRFGLLQGSVGQGDDGKWWWKCVFSGSGSYETEDEAKKRLEEEIWP